MLKIFESHSIPNTSDSFFWNV